MVSFSAPASGAMRWIERTVGGNRLLRRIRRKRSTYAVNSNTPDRIWRSIAMRHILSKASEYPLHPHSSTMRNWNLILVFLMVIEAPLLPLQLAFIPNEDLLEFPWLLWFRIWSELIFWLDTIVQFGIQILPEGNAYWITDSRRIACKYFTGPFIIDLAAVLPLSGLLALCTDLENRGCVLSLLSFHKLLRFTRWPRVVTSLQAHESKIIGKVLQWKHKTKRLGKAIAIVLFSTHVMGCFWACLAMCDGFSSWYHYLGELNKSNDLYREQTPMRVYMCALYWAVYTLTGIGYGDVVPISSLEYTVAIICMVIASLVWAWVVANIVSIVGSVQSSNDYMLTIDYSNELMHEKRVDAELGLQIREYFTKMKDIRDQDAMHDLIDELSPELQAEVVYAIHSYWIDKVWWLRTLPPRNDFMVEVSQNMTASLHCPNETIPNRPELVIIRQGLCLHGGMMLGTGQVWGQDFILNNPALRKSATTLVLTFLQVLVIRRPVFDSVLFRHPEVQAHIRKAFVLFAVMRGVLVQAKALRAAQQRDPTITAMDLQNNDAAMREQGYIMSAVPSVRPLHSSPTAHRARRRRTSGSSRRSGVMTTISSIPSSLAPSSPGTGHMSGLPVEAEPSNADDNASLGDSSVNEDLQGLATALDGLSSHVATCEEKVLGKLRGVECMVNLLKENAQLLGAMT